MLLLVLFGCSSTADEVTSNVEQVPTTRPATTTIPATTSTSDTTTTETFAPETSTPDVDDVAEPVRDFSGTSGDPELDALIDELAIFVEAERGLTFQRRPDIALLDGDEFANAWTELIANDAAENAESYENFTEIYHVMGIISPERSLEEIWNRFGDAGVLGYYDTTSKEIRLRAGEINTLTKTTLVHELVHALEDQVFDLDRESYGERDDEISWAFSSLIEGSARVIENRYRATLSQAELADANAALAALPRTVSLSEFTASFLELQFGRYNYGETFANALWVEGQADLDQAFLTPPTSSELVLDPASFLAGDDADALVSPPPADGQIMEEGVWGEAAWVALLADVTTLGEARQIADGWGGDWYVAWVDGTDTCVRIDLAADSTGELDEYATALTRWVSAVGGRELTSPEAGLLRLTACG